jgi:O-antigen/teichoic acid export membrane protein
MQESPSDHERDRALHRQGEAASDARGHGAYRRILKNTASILISDAAGEAITGYAIALSAVHLGPGPFGALSEAQAFLDPFEAIATFGLTPVAIMLAARRGGPDGALRGTVAAIRVVFAVASGLLALGGALASGRATLVPVLAILAAGLVVSAYWNVQMLPFQVDQAMHRLVALPFLASLVRLSTAYLAVAYVCTPIGFQLSGLAAGTATAFLFGWAARRWYPSRTWFDWVLAKSIVLTAWPAAIEGCLAMAYLRGNYFFLHGGDPIVQGEFAAADRLLRPLLGVGAALSVSALPTVALLTEGRDYTLLRRSFATGALRIAQVLLALLVVAWPLSAWLLSRFAPAYSGSIVPFRILLVGAFFTFLAQLGRTYVAGAGRYQAMMALAAANLAVYIVLGKLLIPNGGAVGAALATAFTEVIGAGALVVFALVMLRRGEQRAKRLAAGEVTPPGGVSPITPEEVVPLSR